MIDIAPRVFRRFAYGLVFDSELELPELHAPPLDRLDRSDVAIRLGTVPSEGLAGGRQLSPDLWARSQELWLQVSGVARFWIRNGDNIVVDPEPGIDEDSIRIFLLGSALGALLFQRGLLVLHGNAIKIGDQCMVCVGDSGAGKSTLAAAFLQRGYPILADDVVPVDSQSRAQPGFPRIKLWKDTARQLNIETEGLRRIRPDIEKFSLPVHGDFVDQPLTVRWIYILSNEPREDVKLEPVLGLERFMPLCDNTYRMSYLAGMDLSAEHLRLVAQLAPRIRLTRLIRSSQGFEIDALVDALLADMTANP